MLALRFCNINHAVAHSIIAMYIVQGVSSLHSSLLYLCAEYYCACAIDDVYLHNIYAHAHEQASTHAHPA